MWEPMHLLMQNHSSHLKGDKVQFILESNTSENGLGTQTKVTLNSMSQCGSRFMRHRNRTEKGMETLFKCIGGSIGKTVTTERGNSSYGRQNLSDDFLGFGVVKGSGLVS